MRILLVNPARKHLDTFGRHSVFPNSLLYIASVLEKTGHEVRIYDNQVDLREPSDFVDFNPQIVGFSVLSGPNIAEAIQQTKEFKALLPDVKIIWGNVHPSVMPQQTIAEDYIDYLCIGAGEYLMVELAKHLETGTPSISEIRGLVWRNESAIVFNKPSDFIQNLDELPDPAWHLIDVLSYWEKSLNTSRGCPSKCTFCYSPLFYKGYSGDLSAERIVNQIEYLNKKYNVRFMRFFEDTFTCNRDRLRRFCELMISRKVPVQWDCDSRIGLADEDIALMSKAGCLSVGLGIESGSPRVIKFIKKGITVKAVEETIERLARHKIMPRLYFIAELPTETLEEFQETQDLIKRLDQPPYQYMPYMPFPGTVLYDYIIKEGLIKEPANLAAWAGVLTLRAINPSYLKIPPEKLDKALDDLRHLYFLRPLRFSLRHMPLYFTRLTPTPAALVKGMKRFFLYFNTRPLPEGRIRGQLR
ncbi:MAG: B12-binding domain-containing radical SAM protein [Dehalogenimonas sp.]